jgi:hypothetical protein
MRGKRSAAPSIHAERSRVSGEVEARVRSFGIDL